MKEYIDKETALNTFRLWLNVKDYSWGERNIIGAMIQMLENMDSVDVVEVARLVGKWEYYKHGLVRCAECHDCYIDEIYITLEKWKFCPTCGARLEYVGNCKA